MAASISTYRWLTAVFCVALIFCDANAAEQQIYSDSFEGQGLSQLNPFWKPYGADVVLGSPPGWVSLQENQTDVYTRIVSKDFSPKKVVRVRMTHHMVPSASRGNHFFPSLDFLLANGQFVEFRWQRSTYSPDYCRQSGGYDKVLVRTSEGCQISTISSSSLYNRNIVSEVRVDLDQGKVFYDLGGDGSIDFEASFTPKADTHIVGVQLQGYGWYTGHQHNIDEITIWGDDDWALPVASPRVGQDFNCYGCVATLSGEQLFHTGMDMTPTGSSAIVAPFRGKVHAVYRTKHPANAWCEGGAARLDEVELSKHNFGNSIILSHITTGGQTIYTQYNHLSCLSMGVALRLLDRATLDEDQQLVGKRTFLGDYGNSDDTELDSAKWPRHLHFEVKTVGTLASGGNTGYASVSADTVGYRDPIEYLYSRQISAPDFRMGIVALDGAKAYSAPGLGIEEGTDLLLNSLPTSALVYIKQKAMMPDGDWFQVNLGLPDVVYTTPCTPVACHDNVVPDGWVHSKYIVAYNGFVAEVPPPKGQLFPVYDAPEGKTEGKKIANVLGSQAFQRYGEVAGLKGKVKCNSYWIEIDLGGVQISPTTTLKRGWICATPRLSARPPP